MLKEKVRRTIVRYRMLERGDRLVVAVSGGPDSVALLSILACLSQELNFSLHVAHLNHMFRAKEAEKDALYVKELAKKFSLPITVRKRNVPAFVRRKRLSPEEGARQVRYKFLENVAEKAGANKIALGQTADDQAETVLMWMLRGSGLKGLAGIPAVRPLENCLIIRPLMEVSRSEIEDYLREEGLRGRVDASNLKPVYLRNKIRLKLLPLLARDYNPNIKSVLSGMSQILEADEEYLTEMQERVFEKVARLKGDNRVGINLASLRKLHPSMQRRILRRSIEVVKGNLQGITLSHLREVLNMINQGRTGSEVHLPKEIVVKRSYQKVFISQGKKPRARVKYSYQLPIPGEAEIEELNLTLRSSLLKRRSTAGLRKSFSSKRAYFDFNEIEPPLMIRNRRRGDRFQPLGMRGRKSLKEFFIDEKIPREERERTPLLVQRNGRDILWVVGWRQAERAKVSQGTKRVLKVEIL